MDVESQNMTAFTSGMVNNDANGYVASLNATVSALEKYIEPLSVDDFLELARQQE